MKLSTKFVYGLQFLLHLCENVNDEYVQVRNVVKSENISEKYLESIVSQLKNGGLLNVKRGALGGYRLDKAPEKITLFDIYEILEGAGFQPDNLEKNKGAGSLNQLAIGELVKQIESGFKTLLREKTLADLFEARKSMQKYHDYQI